MIWPLVDFYKDWGEWGKALMKVLDAQLSSGDNTTPIKPPQYPTASLPPANAEGMVVWNSTTKLLCYSKAGAWYRVWDNGAV